MDAYLSPISSHVTEHCWIVLIIQISIMIGQSWLWRRRWQRFSCRIIVSINGNRFLPPQCYTAYLILVMGLDLILEE